jgi:RNA polymerase sigma-70 factor (ECF subfamily)
MTARSTGTLTRDDVGPPAGSVRELAPRLDDAALVHAARRADAAAKAAIFDRHSERVQRVLLRVLGPDRDLADLLQDVFVLAFRDLDKLSDPSSLGGWLVSIAVHVARRAIRTRARWRWIRFVAPEEVPDALHEEDDAGREELRAVYRVLDRLPEDERIAFALRFLGGMELTTVAESTGVSLATIKRRLQRAEQRFREHAAREPSLSARLIGEEES